MEESTRTEWTRDRSKIEDAEMNMDMNVDNIDWAESEQPVGVVLKKMSSQFMACHKMESNVEPWALSMAGRFGSADLLCTHLVQLVVGNVVKPVSLRVVLVSLEVDAVRLGL